MVKKGAKIERNQQVGVIVGTLSWQKVVFYYIIDFPEFSWIFSVLLDLVWELILDTFSEKGGNYGDILGIGFWTAF